MTTQTFISLHIDIPSGEIPQWIHLFPAGEFPVRNGTKFFKNDAPEKILAAFSREGKIPVDQNHSTDFAAPRGIESPAVGWIVALQQRENGMWGKVEWSKRGKELMQEKAYRFISPVLSVDSESGRVEGVLRAALTNNPDLKMLTSLHSADGGPPSAGGGKQKGEEMDLKKLAKILGLPEGASESEIEACIKDCMATHGGMASMMDMDKGAKSGAILEKARGKMKEKSAHSVAENQLIAELQGQVKDLNGKLSVQSAESFVEKMGRTKIISEGMRQTLISLHASNPEAAKTIVDNLPDAPVGKQISLHGAVGASGGKEDKIFAAFDEQMGLTEEDLKAGGLV